MSSNTYGFVLTGKKSMLMHADDVEASDRLSAWRKDPQNKRGSVAGDDRSPPWTWMTYLCFGPETDGERYVQIPATYLMACLRKASAEMQLKKQKTFKMLSQTGLSVTEDYLNFEIGGRKLALSQLEHLYDKPFSDHVATASKLGFGLMVKRAPIGTAKHVRVRPEFKSWRVSGTVEVLADEITEEVLETMFRLAGSYGFGDWRPGCKTPGPYGVFATQLYPGGLPVSNGRTTDTQRSGSRRTPVGAR